MSPPNTPRIVAIVAAHNEEPTIARAVKALMELRGISEVVVAADGSTDRTAEEAVAAGARVLAARVRAGKGHAVEAAIERTSPADVYLLVDGDVGDTASGTEVLLDEVLAGRLDLAIGRLPPVKGGGFGLVRGVARWLIRLLTGFEAKEPLSGQRAVKRDVLEACRPLADGFGMEVGMTIDAVRLSFRVGEVPVDMSHRVTGRDLGGFAHRARQGLDILRAALPRAMRMR
jgi:glycosyltransferase involved in cell wall biosynthesis